MRVSIPWPPRELSPNAREDRRAIAGIRKRYRQTAWALVLSGKGKIAAWKQPESGLHLSIVFCPPDKRKRDLDNMLASIKSVLDGIADALGVDDSEWSLTISKGAPVLGGSVEITIGTKVAPGIPYEGKI
jgi:crossover junction endodeoxyribonuclease RusA